jgi:hypothetical protein
LQVGPYLVDAFGVNGTEFDRTRVLSVKT